MTINDGEDGDQSGGWYDSLHNDGVENAKEEEEYKMLQLKPTSKEHVVWLIFSVSNLLMAGVNFYLSFLLYERSLVTHEYLSLLSKYDNGVVFSYLIVTFIVLGAVCVFGFIGINNVVMRLASGNARVPPLAYLTVVKFIIAFIIYNLILTQLIILQSDHIAGVSDFCMHNSLNIFS